MISHPERRFGPAPTSVAVSRLVSQRVGLTSMNREYCKAYSSQLHRDMELLVFGHAGVPVIVFPTSMGRFFDYEDRGMIATIGHKYENGAIQAFCLDSVDSESWYNKQIHPRDRVRRHMQYEQYVIQELIPYVLSRNSSPELE